MGQNTNGSMYDANIVDGVCTLSVTDLEEAHVGEEEGEEEGEEGEDGEEEGADEQGQEVDS